ncbi:MAG TPA: FAD-dependent oxidoreductase, partial [Oligoflexia bacterium]|nr:FAD-dependent oxidoreductase [Oligoflexia bacterium]
MQQTVVIGAGISGLALAYELQCAGLDTVVLDSASTPGGVIKSENHGGFLVELGPNSTLTKPPVRCLIEKLALENELVLPQDHARKRFLAIKRSPAHPLELCAAPMSMREAALTPILSPLGKARLFFEPFAKAGQGVDESVDSFISRRVG